MHDQADQLRELVRDASPRRRPGAAAASSRSAAPSPASAPPPRLRPGPRAASLGKQVDSRRRNLDRPASPPLRRPTARHARRRPRRPHACREVLASARRQHPPAAGQRSTRAPPSTAEAVERLDAELTARGRHRDVVLLDAGHGMNPWIDRMWQARRPGATHDHAGLGNRCSTLRCAQAIAARPPAESCSSSSRELRRRRAEANRIQAAFAATCERFLVPGPSSRQQCRPTLRSLPTSYAHRARPALRLRPTSRCEVRILASRVVGASFTASRGPIGDG